MSNCMVVPTYWFTPDLPSWQIFDHPFSIDEVGTLARTLDNLEKMRIQIQWFCFLHLWI